MRAIRVDAYGGTDVLRAADVPMPRPGRGEALVQMAFAGVNFIEIYQRKGQYQVPLPAIPGTEGAGVVTAIGEGVTQLKIGQLVASESLRGSYAEASVAAADRLMVVPDGIGAEIAAAVMLQGLTAHYLALSTHPLKPGDRCIVHAAAGGVGRLLCQIARRCGAHVIAAASTPEKRQLAIEAGAEHAVDYTELVQASRELTSGQGVHVVYDSVGQATFDASLQCLRPRGMLVLYGQSSGPVGPFDIQRLNRAGSLFLTRPTLAHYVATPAELSRRTADLFAWIADGSLTVNIARTVPLAQAGEAHAALESRATAGKVLLRVGEKS